MAIPCPASGEWKSPEEIFTPAEMAFLKRHPVIKVGYDLNWPPYSYRNSAGEHVGLDLDFLALLQRVLPVELELIAGEDWPAMLQMGRDGEVDVLISTALTEARRDDFVFSDVYFPVTSALITRDDQPFALSLGGLPAGSTVAIPSQYASAERLPKDFPHLQLVSPSSYAEAMKMLAAGEVDAVVCNLATATHIIRSLGLTNLKISGFTPYEKHLRFAFHPDHAELAAIFNKAFTAIPETEKLALMSRWIHMNYDDFILWHRMRPRVIAGGLFFLILAGVFLCFHFRQKREIRRRQKAEAALREANQRLTTLNEEKSAIMKMVAHDLRSPITAITLNADLLRMNNLTPAGGESNANLHRTASQIAHQATRVNHLINQLVEVNTLEEGKFIFSPKPINVTQWVQLTVSSHEAMARKKGIQLTSRLPDHPLLAMLDKDPLQQILDNLICNAVKFSPPDTEVMVKLEENDDHLTLSVTDQGPGIPVEEQSRLFEKFCRLSPQPTAGETSTGLGLSIVKFLTEGMGGTVGCRSNPGEGSTFFVTFDLLPEKSQHHHLQESTH